MNTATTIRIAALCLVPLLLVVAAPKNTSPTPHSAQDTARTTQEARAMQQKALNVHYLEIVTPSVQETCEALAAAHGVAFSDPIPELGNARTADLKDGGRIGVRAPMHDAEKPAVRPYVLVEDIQTALKQAEAAGGTTMVPAMQIPGQGTIALYNLGSIEHGLWQK
ncbi:MAG: VOC family protein [Phycisphaerales bacterium]